jgi:hypothetical protein
MLLLLLLLWVLLLLEYIEGTFTWGQEVGGGRRGLKIYAVLSFGG